MGRHTRDMEDRIRVANLEEQRRLQMASMEQGPVPIVIVGTAGPLGVMDSAPIGSLARALFVERRALLPADPDKEMVSKCARDCIAEASIFHDEITAFAKRKQEAQQQEAQKPAVPSVVLP